MSKDLCQCHTKRKIGGQGPTNPTRFPGEGPGGTHQSFFWYDNDKDLWVCFSMTWLIWYSSFLLTIRTIDSLRSALQKCTHDNYTQKDVYSASTLSHTMDHTWCPSHTCFPVKWVLRGIYTVSHRGPCVKGVTCGPLQSQLLILYTVLGQNSF